MHLLGYMKKIHNIFFVIALTTLLIGCEDYLNVKPRGYDVSSKCEHYRGLLYGESVSYMPSFPFMCIEYDTNEDGFKNLYYTNSGSVNANAFLWKKDIYREDEDCSEWNDTSRRLYSLNVIINEVLDAEDGSEEERLTIQAEARMMRAWYTFMMAQWFGAPYDESTAATAPCVPIITSAQTMDTHFTRSTNEQVYAFIISEMEAAIPNLSNQQEHFMRVFLPTGYAMLGKVYWTMNQYDKALGPLKMAKQLLDQDGGRKLFDYNTMVDANGSFNYPNYSLNNTEFVYYVETMYNLWIVLYPQYYNKIMLWIKPNLLKEVFPNTKDNRLYYVSNLATKEPVYGQTITVNGIYHTNITRMISNIGLNLADIYLMLGETYARTGDLDSARSVVEALRRCRVPYEDAPIPTTVTKQQDMIRYIVQERLREYIGYGLTWFDTRRLWNDPLFQDLKQYYTHTDGVDTYTLTEERLTLSIPPSIMVWNPHFAE